MLTPTVDNLIRSEQVRAAEAAERRQGTLVHHAGDCLVIRDGGKVDDEYIAIVGRHCWSDEEDVAVYPVISGKYTPSWPRYRNQFAPLSVNRAHVVEGIDPSTLVGG